MADTASQVECLKQQGNAALQQGKVDEAIDFYSKAIALDTDNSVLYSNRSAAFCKAKKYVHALDDAEKVVTLKPTWVKGYSRKGAALALLNRHEEAMHAYMEGLSYDSNNEQLKEGIRQSKLKLSGPGGSQPLMNPFAGLDIWNKIAADSRTKEYLKDPDYKEMITSIQNNPQELGKHMQDQRVMTTLGVLLGVDLQGSSPGEYEDEEMPQVNKEPTPPKETKKAPTPPKDTNSEALKEKELGNVAYKKKDFETAILHYDKAIELEPTNVVFRNNKAAVYFEQQKYNECIQICDEAILIGRENRADFKIIAKSYARIGNAHLKLDDLDNALKFFEKSLTEFRDNVLVKKTQEIRKLIKERERLSYLDPEKSLAEKQLGNAAFTKGDYPTAVKHYSEAIKRNPDDAKLYSNRAACFTKLLEFPSALRDAEECIRIEPTFVKGYLRKAGSLVAMKEMSKAGDAYRKAMELDSKCQEAIDGYRKCVMSDSDPEAVKKRAMQDPEVQAILGDPAMQLILQQMQKDPRALQEHLQNPAIEKKITKLMEVGLLAFR